MKISEIIVIVLLIYNLITFLLMGIDKFIAQPLYPIIKSIQSVSIDIAMDCTITFEAMLIFL